jgi:hypothetical protein
VIPPTGISQRVQIVVADKFAGPGERQEKPEDIILRFIL